MAKPLSRNRILAAWLIALAADAAQIVLFPLFAGGALEGADAALDAGVALLLVMLCGFHVAFLPTIAAELLPVVDAVPSWTLAVMYVTKGRAAPAAAKLPQASFKGDSARALKSSGKA